MSRTPKIQTTLLDKGYEITFRHWPSSSASKRCVVMFHRGHEHSGRMQHVVDELNLPEHHFFAWDARGHGLNPGPKGYSPSFSQLVRDAYAFLTFIHETHDIDYKDMILIGQSVGAVIASSLIHDYAVPVRGMVLASPAFSIKLYVPLAKEFLGAAYKLRGVFYVNSYVKAKFLTHDKQRIKSFESDPLIARPIAVNVLLDLYEAADRIVQDAAAITAPTLLLISGSDGIVRRKPQEQFFKNLGSAIKEKHVLKGFFHDTLGEKNRAAVMQQIRDFISRIESADRIQADLTEAHKKGHTYQEALEIAEPLPLLSLKKWQFKGMKFSIHHFVKHISKGVAVGVKTGFDSGSTLDYVYENQVNGKLGFGQLIDKNFLNAVGWKGIRARKVHIESMIQEASDQLNQQGDSVRIVDIAAGHGRYVLDAVQKLKEQPQSVLLRDYSAINVDQGLKSIAARGLSSFANFEQADAFDADSLREIKNKPNLLIVSGLYELFSDNEMIMTSLKTLAEVCDENAILIYTGQPWHPQLEMIARALTSHRQGQAWVMRRRTQAELDQLVSAAGFTKTNQMIDDWGIFTVSSAKKAS